MKERPILFSGPMVRAILAGSKTQTRRVVTEVNHNLCESIVPTSVPGVWYVDQRLPAECYDIICPHGTTGDRLWVRETWQQIHRRSDGQCFTISLPSENPSGKFELIYAATCADGDHPPRWRPSIHMPRWASRITLEVTGVRVERVQEIGKDGRKAKDVLAEGVTREAIQARSEWFHPDDCPALAFAELWNNINAKRGFGWDANPWVWVIEFKRAEIERAKG